MDATHVPLSWPTLTGALARRLAVPEHRIAAAIRSGRVPAPPVQGGRRLWWPRHVRVLAEHLGRLTPDLDAELEGLAGATR